MKSQSTCPREVIVISLWDDARKRFNYIFELRSIRNHKKNYKKSNWTQFYIIYSTFEWKKRYFNFWLKNDCIWNRIDLVCLKYKYVRPLLLWYILSISISCRVFHRGGISRLRNVYFILFTYDFIYLKSYFT